MAHPTSAARILPFAARVTETIRFRVERDLLGDSAPIAWLLDGLAAQEARFLRPQPENIRGLRGKSRDRLDTWGSELFETRLLPRLKPEGVARVRRALAEGKTVVLESDALDHAVRPLARWLGATRWVARALEYREDRATGRLKQRSEETDLASRRADRALLVDDPREPALRIGAFSVRRALEGRRVLAAGASGFLGKVWLAKLLHDLPDLGEVTVLLRPRREASAAERFRELLATSPVFDPLRTSPTDDLVRLLDRVRVVNGDVSKHDLGLDPAARDALQGSVDLVVSFAGQTDFNPDLRDALAANVDSTVHLLDFVRGCRDAALLHVSTCFVAGAREGRVTEQLFPFETPLGLPFDPEGERRRLHETVDAHLRQARGGGGAQARPFRRALIEAGRRRALELGWPNIYTFTKALGEALLVTRGADLPVAVVRPSIVETSTEFPRRGWAEGTNTSAPLSHLLGTPFRHLPVNERKRLDVIPVDAVARGTTLVAAALLLRRHHPVYHLATSVANPLDLRRAVELTALAHRRHYRQMRQLKHRLLERMETVPVSRERYRRLSVPLQLRVVRALNRIFAFSGRRPFGRFERRLRRVHDLIDLYEPFLLHNEPVFEAERIEWLVAALPEDERDAFGYDVSRIDWYEYWVDVHIPALRHWSYPLLEGGAIPETDAATAAERAGVPAADVAAGSR